MPFWTVGDAGPYKENPNFFMRTALCKCFFSVLIGRNCNFPFARSATSLMRSITSLRSRAFARSATSFFCAARTRNDVLAALERKLTFGQMMLYLRHK